MADDKLVYTYMPDLIRYYLSEEPLLPNVETYRLDEPDALDGCSTASTSWWSSRSTARAAAGIVIGPQATPAELGALRERLRADPRGWIAQRPVALSTVADAHRRDASRRGTSTCGRSPSTTATTCGVLPGGLTRVALPEGALVVNSSQGGGSKDTWVLAARTSRHRMPPPSTPSERRGCPPAAGRPPGRRSRHRPAERTRAMTSDLLSRMAETLFWTGRYIERADDTARLVDVYVHRLLGDPGVQRAGSGADCGPLFGLLGVEPPEDDGPDVGTALFRLAYDTKSPSAIAGAVLAARAGARGIREVISSEMWECLNVAGHGLTGQRRAADRLGPHVFLRFIRERAALFFGLADSTMSHDDAWRFLILGRSLERADMTARLLLARMPGPPEHGWPLLLRACGAYESFMRTHGGAAEPALVAEFLLLRPAVPAVGAARAGDRRGLPGRAEPGPGPDGHGRPGPPSGRPAADPARVRRHQPADRPAPRTARHACSGPARRPARRSPGGTSSTRRRWPGNRDG